MWLGLRTRGSAGMCGWSAAVGLVVDIWVSTITVLYCTVRCTVLMYCIVLYIDFVDFVICIVCCVVFRCFHN